MNENQRKRVSTYPYMLEGMEIDEKREMRMKML